MEEVKTSEVDSPSGERPSTAWLLARAGIWIAAAPALGFALGQAYEVGHAKQLGIPAQLVSVRPESITVAVGVSVVLVFFVVAAWAFASRMHDAAPAQIRERLLPTQWAAGAGLVVGLVFSFSGWLAGTVAAVGVVVVLAAAGVIRRSRNEKLQKWRTLIGQEAGRSLGISIGVTVLVLGVVGFSHFLGRNQAARAEEFMVYNDPVTRTDMVVLRTYGDLVIAAELDRDAATIGPVYRVLEMKEAGALRREHLGRLKTAEPLRAEERVRSSASHR